MKKIIAVTCFILVGCSSAPKSEQTASNFEELHMGKFKRTPAQVESMPCPDAQLEGGWVGADVYHMEGSATFQADVARLLPESVHGSASRNLGYDRETVVFADPPDKEGNRATGDLGSFHHQVSRRYFVAVSTNSHPNEVRGVKTASNNVIVVSIQADYDDSGIWPTGYWFQIKSCTVKYKYLGVVEIQPSSSFAR